MISAWPPCYAAMCSCSAPYSCHFSRLWICGSLHTDSTVLAEMYLVILPDPDHPLGSLWCQTVEAESCFLCEFPFFLVWFQLWKVVTQTRSCTNWFSWFWLVFCGDQRAKKMHMLILACVQWRSESEKDTYAFCISVWTDWTFALVTSSGRNGGRMDRKHFFFLYKFMRL